jgi:tetratricopeptide (TPR) repeat protein
VDRAVIATANELLGARHFPGVVAICSDALESEPGCVPLLVARARAHIALRRELDAQADLRDIIRLDPQCGIAYRLLGELAARRDENESAAIFFREALRLDPDDQEARDWQQIVDVSLRPAAVATPPAPAAAAGRFPMTRAPVERGRSHGAEPSNRTLSSPARYARPGSQPRFARGTRAHDQDERPTKPFARGSVRDGEAWKTPTPTPYEPTISVAPSPIPPTPLPLPPPPNQLAREQLPRITLPGRPPLPRPASPRKLPPPRRSATPELPGFGEYLVASGILSRERLRAAQAYQRSMKVQLSTAIVTLGLATPQRIAWAAVAHQSQLARDRQLPVP